MPSPKTSAWGDSSDAVDFRASDGHGPSSPPLPGRLLVSVVASSSLVRGVGRVNVRGALGAPSAQGSTAQRVVHVRDGAQEDALPAIP